MKPQVDVIIQPYTIRFSLYKDELVYHMASSPDMQLDDMERLFGVDPAATALPDCNMGFLPVASVVLIRGERNVIVDPGNHHIGFYGMLKDALKRKGLTYEDIDKVVVTHWHHDHFSNITLFKGKELIIGEGELAFGESIYGKEEVRAKIAGFDKVTIVPAGEPLRVMAGVEAYLTPGHTPGSISLIARAADRTYAIVGDNAMTRTEWTERKFSHWYPPEQAELIGRSLDRIAAEKPDRIIFGHDRMLSLT